jgi:hypothetical protein
MEGPFSVKIVSNYSLRLEQLWPPVWREPTLADRLAKTARAAVEMAHTELLGDENADAAGDGNPEGKKAGGPAPPPGGAGGDLKAKGGAKVV